MDSLRVRRVDPAIIAFGLVATAAGALLVALQHDLTFVYDEWAFLTGRREAGPDAFLRPHNEHLVLLPVAIYKLLLVTFGMETATPFQVAGTLIFLASTATLFIYLRRRVGGLLALVGSAVVLFLGPAWSHLLWPFQMGFSGCIACGIGALLALERGDRRGDLAACALLFGSVAFSTMGVSFVAAGILDVLMRGGRERLARAWVPALSLAFFAVWWLGWGREAPSLFSFQNALESPGYIFDGVAQSLASITGFSEPFPGFPNLLEGVDWGRALLVLLLPLAIWRVWRGGMTRGLALTLAVGLTFWGLAALNAIPILREPTSARYQYPGVMFALLIAAELAAGAQRRRPVVIAVTVAGAAAIASNFGLLSYGADEMKGGSDQVKARLFALEAARPVVPAEYELLLDPIGFSQTTAGDYFSVADRHGTPAFSEPELVAQPDYTRSLVDHVIADAEMVEVQRLTPEVAETGRDAGCRYRELRPADTLSLPPGELWIRADPGSTVRLRLGRYADGLPVRLDPFTSTAARLRIPRDDVRRPWTLGRSGRGSVRVCRVSVT